MPLYSYRAAAECPHDTNPISAAIFLPIAATAPLPSRLIPLTPPTRDPAAPLLASPGRAMAIGFGFWELSIVDACFRME